MTSSLRGQSSRAPPLVPPGCCWFLPVPEGTTLTSAGSAGLHGDTSSPSDGDQAEASAAPMSPFKASKTQDQLHRELLLAHRR